MKRVLDTLTYPLILIAIAYLALSGGLLTDFIAFNILIPFLSILFSLMFFTFGRDNLVALIKAILDVFRDKKIAQVKNHCDMLDVAIKYSYVANSLWVLYVIIISGGYSYSSNQLQLLISQVALAMNYSFILSELFLRPVKNRLLFTHNTQC